jgi:hypothetical protein
MRYTNLSAPPYGAINTVRLTGLILAVFMLLLAFSLPAEARDRRHDHDNDGGDELPFEDTVIRIEVNETDGDAGL